MITRDMVTGFILAVNRFVTKRGEDIESRRKLVEEINRITGEDSCDGVYVNSVDNYLIPDVAVIHLYSTGFSQFLLNPDAPDTCPFGYTVEIHSRCFKKYSEEEIAAIIIHDILQNVQSDTAKIRFLKAYTAVMEKHDISKIMGLFDKTNLDEITFMAFTEICLRPFRVPVMASDYVATDDVLKVLGLGDAYDSYLEKVLPVSNNTPEEAMERCLHDDYRDVNTIISACLDNDIRHYYTVVRESAPLVTLENILGSRQAAAAVGFVSRKKEYKRRTTPEEKSTLSETYNDPKTELDIQFQIDKIISSMRYAESEAEREVILYKIKNLSIKLAKMEYRLSNRQHDPRVAARIEFLRTKQKELEDLRKEVVKMEVKTKRWSVYVKDQLPAEYNF